MKPIIHVENLSKQYTIGAKAEPYSTLRESLVSAVRKPIARMRRGMKSADSQFWALRDVSFDVMPGEVVGIIGRNGAGKSTLLKILSRITEPTSGKVELFGRVGSLLEVGTGFHPELTGRENIFLNGAILGMRREEIAKKFDEIVDFAEIEEFLDTPVKRYSSGMYMRLAFAVAANLEPEILIVDEVLAVGDAQFQKKCLGKMKDVSEHGRTVLFVSHNMAAIAKLCDRCVFLNGGRIGLDGSLREAISLYNSENLSDRVEYEDEVVKQITAKYTSQGLQIVVVYQRRGTLDYPNLGFVVSDPTGTPIFGTNTKTSYSKPISLSSNAGEVSVMVREPKLLAGIYSLSVWFGNETTDFFHRRDCLSFEVNIDAASSQLPAETVGYIIPNCEWTFT